MRVVFVSPEAAPLAKVGGLADVAGALPLALRQAGEAVSVILPLYRFIDRAKYRLTNTGKRVRVWMDGRFREGAVWRHRRKGVAFYLIESPDYFDRDAVYGPPGGDYLDNQFRFAFFARAALDAAKVLALRPDVFHVNDWQTALLPVYLRYFDRGDPIVGGAAVVLSIHNLAYQGLFGKENLSRLGLPWEVFHMEAVEFHDRINFLKGGIAFSDFLSTVSPTYAREIQTPAEGFGLDSYLQKRSSDLVGILNGIDTEVWDPSQDRALFAPYSVDDPSGKAANKRRLQEELGLSVTTDRPLLAVVGRLDPQKGLDLVVAAAPALLGEGAQLVILGSGQRGYLEAFRSLKERFPHEVSLNEGYHEELGRRIYAGADLFLMPSRFEPCGLGQMIALRYGAVPVVRRTGGLADTIIDVDDSPQAGNGYVFGPFDPAALLDAVHRALGRFRDAEAWRVLVKHAMRADFSWGRSAKRYLELYQRAVRRVRGPARKEDADL